MKKTAILSLVLGLSLMAGSTIANAQTFVYPVTTGSYGSPSCVAFTVDMGLGSSDAYTGGQVSALQELLNRDGYLSGVSGTYDNGTYGAIINYQRAHGIVLTGTVGPITRAALSADGCNSQGIAYNGYGNGYGSVSPASTCGWYNGIYQCGQNNQWNTQWNNQGNNNNWSNCYSNYNNGYYSNGNYFGGCNNSVTITSLSASYAVGGTTITINGYGFNTSGNTVHFGNYTIPNVYSANGTMLTFTVPANSYYGSYPVSVVTPSGGSSNSLTFDLSVPTNNNGCYNQYNNNNTQYNNGYNNGYYNNGYYSNGYNNGCNNNSTVTLSSITGPTSVQTGTSNTWSVTAYNQVTQYQNYQNNQNVTISTNWGDSSSSNGQQYYSNNQNTYTFNHVYNTPGTYTIRTTATNSSGYSTVSNLTVTVYGNSYNNYQYQY